MTIKKINRIYFKFFKTLILCLLLLIYQANSDFYAYAQETNLKKNSLLIPKMKNLPYKPKLGRFGGIRRFSSLTPPRTFNVFLAAETSSTDILDMMYIGLVRVNPVTTEIVPELAESWEISKDKKIYTFKLKKDLRWSDGEPLNAADIDFTFNKIINNPEIPNNYRENMLIEQKFPVVEMVNNLTVRFITPIPFSPFLRLMNAPIVPKHILEDFLEKDSDNKYIFNYWGGIYSIPESIVCNGPFEIEKFIPDKGTILRKNKYYWRKDLSGQQLPYYEKIFIEIEKNEFDIYNKFMSKETDILEVKTSTPRIEDFLKPVENQTQFKTYNLGQNKGNLFIVLNQSTAKDKNGRQIVPAFKSAWFRNIEFRKALAYAVDRKLITEKIYNGLAIPQYSYLSRQNPYYNLKKNEFEFNLQKARQILEKAGFKKNKNGELIDPQKNRVEIDLITNQNNNTRDKICKIINSSWKKLGIKINYNMSKFSAMMKQVNETLNWDIMLLGISESDFDPHSIINVWKLDGPGHIFNMGNPAQNKIWQGRETSYQKWENEIFNLFDEASREFNPIKRKELYFKAQEIEYQNVPFIYIAKPISLLAVKNNIGNIFPTINARNGLNIINWNIDEQYNIINDQHKISFLY